MNVIPRMNWVDEMPSDGELNKCLLVELRRMHKLIIKNDKDIQYLRQEAALVPRLRQEIAKLRKLRRL